MSFWLFYFLTETDYFAKSISFGKWPFLAIFEMVPFLEYQMFFKAVFSVEQL